MCSDANTAGNGEETPLAAAAKHGRDDILQYLLSKNHPIPSSSKVQQLSSTHADPSNSLHQGVEPKKQYQGVCRPMPEFQLQSEIASYKLREGTRWSLDIDIGA